MSTTASGRHIEFLGAGSTNAIGDRVPLFSCSACFAVVRGADIEAHRAWHGGSRGSQTVMRSVATVLREHYIVDGTGGAIANPCVCGFESIPGHFHSDHVAEKLREAGLLVPDAEKNR